MKVFNGSITFRIFGIAAICLSFIHYFVQRLLDKFSNGHGKTLNITQEKPKSNDSLRLDDKYIKVNNI